jgi:hypothetical protein
MVYEQKMARLSAVPWASLVSAYTQAHWFDFFHIFVLIKLQVLLDIQILPINIPISPTGNISISWLKTTI